MAKWAVTGSKGAANVQGVLTINAAAASPRRAKLYDWTMGCSATPAELAFVHIGQYSTTAGTGSARTPTSIEPADTLASTIVCKDTVTADPTLTAGAFLFRKALNQRATFRWVASREGSEIVIPAVANAGILLGLSAASTQANFDYDAAFLEE